MTDNNVKTMHRRSQSQSARPQREYAGVPLGDQPAAKVPALPSDLADVDDRELMRLFSLYIAWQNFIAVKVTEAEILEAERQTELTVGQAQALLGSWSGTKEDRVALARAEREVHPEVIKQQDAYNTAKAHRKMLSTLADNMERAAAVVSRELTRRVGREPVERRHRGWTP